MRWTAFDKVSILFILSNDPMLSTPEPIHPYNKYLNLQFTLIKTKVTGVGRKSEVGLI
jgi:hypothetical protein